MNFQIYYFSQEVIRHKYILQNMPSGDSNSNGIGDHDEVIAVPGMASYSTCTTCKLSAVHAEDLADYPCESNKYHPYKGEGQPTKLEEERFAYEILRFGDKDDLEVPNNRSQLSDEAKDWLEKIEEYSEVISREPEEEKLRVAAQWRLEMRANENPD